MTTRARVDYVMERSGLSRRTIQAMAARGQIPGAAKLGSTWTFDKLKLARWIKHREDACQTTSIKETASGMRAFKWRDGITDGPLKQLLRQKQSAV